MKFLSKSLLILIGAVLLLILGANLLLTYKSKEILQEIVSNVSDEKYRLEAKKVSLYFKQAGIKAEHVNLIPVTDAPRQATLSFEKLEIRINSLFKVLFRKNLEVLKIEIIKPDITTYAKDQSGTQKNGIAETIHQIQNTLLQSIEALNVKDVNIADAAIKIYTADTLSKKFFALNHINLHLYEIYFDKEAKEKGEGLSANGELTLLNPSVHLTDSNVSVGVHQLSANVKDRSLEIDTLDLRVNRDGRRPQNIKLSNLQITHLHWSRFLKEGVIEIDTLLASKGLADISLSNKKKEDNPAEKEKAYSGGTFIIHHTLISDILYRLHKQQMPGQMAGNASMNVEADSLYLRDFSLQGGREPAFMVEDLKVAFRDFKVSDKRKTVTLGALSLDTTSLVLKNYLLETNKADAQKNYFRIAVPDFRLNNYDLEEVLQKKLDATSIQLTSPEITIDIRQAKKEKKAKKDIDKVFDALMQKVSDKASLEEIIIDNGNFTIFPTLSPDDKINISGLSLVIDATKFPDIEDAHDFIHAIKRLDSKGFVVKGKNMDLTITDMQLMQTPRGIRFGTVKGNFGDGKMIDLQGVTVLINDSISNYKRKSDFHASAIMVESGMVSLDLIKKDGTKKNGGKAPALLIDTLKLNNVVFSMKIGKTTGASAALNVHASDLALRDKQIYWTTLDLNAANPKAAFGNTRFNAGIMSITQPGNIQIKNAAGSNTTKFTSIQFSAPEVDINLGLNSTYMPLLKIEGIKLTKPQLSIKLQKKDKPAPAKAGKVITQDISLKSIMLEEPTIDLFFMDSTGAQKHQHKVFTGTFVVKDIHTLNEPELRIGNLSYSTLRPKSEFPKMILNPAALRLSISDISFNTLNKHFKLHVDSVVVQEIAHTLIGKKNDTLQLEAKALGVGNITYEKGQKIQVENLLKTANWWAQNVNVHYNTQKQLMMAKGLSANGEGQAYVSLDSFHLLNRNTKEEVWNANAYEKGYETITGGKLLISGIGVALPEKKPVITISKFRSNNLHFTTEKDKTKLEDTIDYRPLLTRMFTNIPVPLKIDSVLLNNARVDAHEISKKTGQRTHIFFSDINGYLKNVKTWDVQQKDTLDMRVRALFYGTDQLRLHFKQSYDDTLQGFWMRVRMSHFNMPEMNKLLTPLMGLKIHSGTIDSLLLVANGNDYFAYGTMDLRFHDLHAKILKTEDSKGKLLISIENFLAGLILPKHDNGRTNLLFKDRLRKRSIFNFWAKIGLEGLLTNLGIKKDKKERKQFENSIEKYKLPERYWEDIDDLNP